jgi:hypothetical protein
LGLSPLGTAATSGLLYKQMIDEGDCGAIGGIKIGRGNRNTRMKPAPVPLCPPQIPHDQTRAWTRAAAVGSQWITDWAMVQSKTAMFLSDNLESHDNHIHSFQWAGQSWEWPLYKTQFALKVVLLYLQITRQRGILCYIFQEKSVLLSGKYSILVQGFVTLHKKKVWENVRIRDQFSCAYVYLCFLWWLCRCLKWLKATAVAGYSDFLLGRNQLSNIWMKKRIMWFLDLFNPSMAFPSVSWEPPTQFDCYTCFGLLYFWVRFWFDDCCDLHLKLLFIIWGHIWLIFQGV